MHPAAPARQDLVPVSLMTHVPDEFVLGRVEDMMHGNCKFNDSETGAEVAPGLRDLVHDVGTQLLAQLTQLLR